MASCGDTVAEAFEKAEECLGMGISDYIKDGKKLPDLLHPEETDLNKDEYLMVISVDIDEWMKKYEVD